jgi:hypothetical protein
MLRNYRGERRKVHRFRSPALANSVNLPTISRRASSPASRVARRSIPVTDYLLGHNAAEDRKQGAHDRRRQRTGIGSAADIDIDTLERRMTADQHQHGGIFKPPTLVGTWARVAR